MGIFWGILRIVMGWTFLWAFLDKTFGLGFATTAENSWLAGGSPTAGFLANAPQGPLAGIFQSLAGSGLVDWLFMLGLLGVGVSLIFGIVTRLGAIAGAAMLALMYFAVLPPENNPFIDDHIVYILVMVGLVLSRAGNHLSITGGNLQTKNHQS